MYVRYLLRVDIYVYMSDNPYKRKVFFDRKFLVHFVASIYVASILKCQKYCRNVNGKVFVEGSHRSHQEYGLIAQAAGRSDLSMDFI